MINIKEGIALKSILLVFVGVLLLVLSVNVSAWTLSGNVYDIYGGALNNTNVSVNSMYMPGGVPPTYYSENSTTTNASGFFNLSVAGNSSRNYLIAFRHRNSTTNAVDYVGASLPYLPNQIFSNGLSSNFYLKSAGTINITAINSTDRILFNYQIKDTILGYTIDSNWNNETGTTEANVYVPTDRNYSIMIYPRTMSIPLSYTWDNFTSASTYVINNISTYNATTKTIHKQFNTTMSMIRMTGYLNGSLVGVIGWNNFTLVPMVLEAGNFIFLQHSALPYNMSSWTSSSDIYNYTSGFYNITLPGPAEAQTILVYVAAFNGTNYYGSYKNISISTTSPGEQNFTIYRLIGSSVRNISMSNPSGGAAVKVETKMYGFNLVNSTTNATLTFSPEAHVEVDLDYSAYGAKEFTVTDSVSGTGVFYLPLLNVTGTKETNVYSNSFAPRRVAKRTVAQLEGENNISLSSFNPQTRGGNHSGTEIAMKMLTSNSTCDVPNPDSACYLGNSSMSAASFNPMSAVIGGGKVSFRMGYGNISVHYVNVDMLASGPPDANFDSAANNVSSGSAFNSALKFGSQGPTIYDFVLVSVPYTDSGVGALNDSQAVNVSIPLLYDENWNIIWNSTANGTSGDALAGNDTHYNTYKSQWEILMNGTTCTSSNVSVSSQINSSSPCYIDAANNRVWIRLPHFSGTEPSISGSAVTASTAAVVDDTSGTGTGAVPFWTATFILTDTQFKEGYTKDLYSGQRFKVAIDGESHYIGVVSLNSSSATINISSTPQRAVFFVGDEKKFDVTNDSTYDLLIRLNSLTGGKANLTITSINETIAVSNDSTDNIGNTNDGDIKEEGSSWKIILIIIVAIVLGIAIFFVLNARSRHNYSRKGY